jgi:RHS repeat-associated protein
MRRDKGRSFPGGPFVSSISTILHDYAAMYRRRLAPRSRRVVALVTSFMLVVQVALAGPVYAAAHDASDPGYQHTPSVPVAAVTSHYTKPKTMAAYEAPKTVWPSGTSTLALSTDKATRAGSLPIALAAVGAGASTARASAGKKAQADNSTPRRAKVSLEPQSVSSALGLKGVVFSVGRADGVVVAGQVQVSLSYASFKDAYGGDWAQRLALVALPACALTTPQLVKCHTETPVKFTNDGKTQSLSAAVTLPGSTAATASSSSTKAQSDAVASVGLVLAATATTSSSSGSGGGTFSATSLKSSGAWSAGGATDAFTWSYPMSVPDVPGGLKPSLALSYDSQSLDGLTSNTNNQAGDFGDGWDVDDSYIERSYASCWQNPPGPTQSYDNCWSSNNQLTVDLNGVTTTIVKDDTTGDYVAENDGNERIQPEVGAVNGAQKGEYWIITTSDGTQYYFGLNQLPGYASGDPTTDSVDTEPVYATTSGQPCYNATFSSSYCEQAYRWNLDYVVDTDGDAMSYWYGNTTNYYAQDAGTSASSTSAYTQDSYLSKIEYGQRDNSLFTATPAAEVQFTVSGRCSTSSTGCAISTLSSSTATNWPDVPDDLICASGATCPSQSPSFFSEEEVTGIQTLALDGTGLDDVDSWALKYSFPAITGSGDTSTPSLWLASITQTGQDTTAEPSGGAAIPLPSVTFTGTAMQNRVNLTDGYPWITRYRLTKITTETGEQITVNYSAPTTVAGEPSSDSDNTTLAYPVNWYPTISNTPTKDYFNVYIVDSVTENDPTGGSGNDAITTKYTPVGNPAWHYDDNPLMPTNQVTWDQFRGYQGMIVSTGTAPDPVTKTEYTYFQGMDGDYLTSTSTRSASVTDSRNDSPVPDYNQYAGATYETQVFNGTSPVTDTIDTPWTSGAEATHVLSGGVPSQQAFFTGEAEEQVYTPLASGSTQETETTYTHDSYGRVIQTNALGDVTQPSQNKCTTVTYDDNTSLWILDAVAETNTVSVNCSATATFPADAVSDVVHYYDGASNDTTAPTVGNVTETLVATSYSSSGTPTYTMQSEATVDEYGRALTSTDADNRVTTTAYTPATGAEPTSIVVTDPMSMATTTAYDPLRDLATEVTTAGGDTTVSQYDALGRVIAVYKPGFTTAGLPNLKYTYTVSDSGPSVTDTYTINDDGTYQLSETLHDSMMRAREVQTETPDGGRDITDTYYNTDGWESETTSAYYNSSAVSTTFVQAQVGDIPSATGYAYDGDGRTTAEIAYADGDQTWETTQAYGGNFVTTVPPAGGTAQTTVINALGEKTDLIQYLAGEPTNYVTDPVSDYTDTKYTYYPSGKQATEVDAAGNTWSWTYDLLGDQLTASDPDAGTANDTYDNAGQLIKATDARGKQTTYVYDKDGRETAEYDTTSTSTLTAGASGNEIASRTYDTLKKGYLTSSTSYSNGDTITESSTGYTSLDETEGTKVTLTGTDAALVPATGYTTKYGYTYTGLLAGQTDPAMGGLPLETLNYTYDEFGQPTELSGTANDTTQDYVSAVAYTELGQTAEYTLPAGGGHVWASEAYDPQTQALDKITTTDSTSTAPVDTLTYTYGNSAVSQGSGLLTRVQDVQNTGGNTGTSTAETDTQCFTYDYAQRLTEAWTATDDCAATPTTGNSSTVGGPISPYWQSWTYDAAGDRTSETDYNTAGDTADDTVTTYNYPAAGSSTDQPTTLSNTTATGPNAAAETAGYAYNPAGEEISSTGGTLGNETYDWNDQDKLQSTVSSAGTTNYAYDADGDQVIMRDPGSTTLTVGDAQLNLVAGSGSVTGVRYYTIGGVTIAERTSAGAVNCLIPDRQGTDELAITATAAQTVTRRQYLPFGAARDGSTWVGGDQGYIGGQADTTTGLETLGAREYDAIDGRFTSVDPVFEADDPTQIAGYDYSGNDPVSSSDPTGDMRSCGPTGCPTSTGNGGGSNAGGAGGAQSIGNGVGCDILTGAGCQSASGWNSDTYDFTPPAPAPAPPLRCTYNRFGSSCSGGDTPVDTEPEGTWGDFGWGIGSDVVSLFDSANPVAQVAGLFGYSPSQLYNNFAVSEGANVNSQRYDEGVGTGIIAESVVTAPLGGEDAAGIGLLCGGDSFTPSTLVLTATGKQIPISQLKVGDSVEATSTTNGKTEPEEVAAVLVHHDTNLYDLTVKEDGKTTVIHTTSNHLFWVPGTGDKNHAGKWVTAAQLKPGTHLRTPDGANTAAVVGGVAPASHDSWMWDLTIPGNNDHDFYVATGGGTAVLVHNCDPAPTARFSVNSNGVATDLDADMSRAGKPFTPAGKRAVIQANMVNGVTTCDDCGVQTVPATRSRSGVPVNPDETRVDHIWPQSLGGPGSPWNGRVTCFACNADWSDYPKGPLS